MSFKIDFFTKGKYYKQSYEKSDYDETYKIALFLAKWVSIRMTHQLSKFKSICWEVLYWFEFANLWLAIVVEFLSMIETGRGGSFDDLAKIFRMLPCAGFVFVALAKSYKMVRSRSVFENLISEMRAMWPEGPIGEEEREYIGSALRYLNFMVKGYNFCNNVMLLMFVYPPYWEAVKRWTGHQNEKILHLFYWLPYDPLRPIYYEITVAVQSWHSFVTIWANLSGDLLFAIFMSHVTLQFNLLAIRIKKLIFVPIDKQLIKSYPLGKNSEEYINTHSMAIETFSEGDWEEYYTKEISEIILRHRALIRLSGDIEDMFSFALFINFLNSSFVLCFCGFCCVVVEKWNEFAYKAFLVSALSQMWIMCWYGQQLVDSSAGISNAVYESGWYLAPKKLKSSLLIMLLRSQKSLYVTTYGFSNISMASYSTIIKTSWSYFTLLLNTYKQ